MAHSSTTRHNVVVFVGASSNRVVTDYQSEQWLYHNVVTVVGQCIHEWSDTIQLGLTAIQLGYYKPKYKLLKNEHWSKYFQASIITNILLKEPLQVCSAWYYPLLVSGQLTLNQSSHECLHSLHDSFELKIQSLSAFDILLQSLIVWRGANTGGGCARRLTLYYQRQILSQQLWLPMLQQILCDWANASMVCVLYLTAKESLNSWLQWGVHTCMCILSTLHTSWCTVLLNFWLAIFHLTADNDESHCNYWNHLCIQLQCASRYEVRYIKGSLVG